MTTNEEKPSSCTHRERFESWTVLYKLHENGCSMHFFVLPHFDAGASFVRAGLDSPEPTEDPDEAQVFAVGFIKWDGCANFDLGDDRDDSYRHHTCGRAGMANLGEMLNSVVDVAARVIPKWDARVSS